MSALTGAEQLYETLDARTLQILERRRNATVIRRRGWLIRRLLLGADLIGLTAAFVSAELIAGSRLHEFGALDQFTETAVFIVSLPLWVVAAKLYGLYDRDEERADHSTADDFARLFHLLTVCTFLLYAISRLTMWFAPQFSKLFLFWLIGIAGVTSLRALVRAYGRRHISYLQNTIIIGAGEIGQTLARIILNHPEYGIHVVGFVDDTPRERQTGLRHLAILGGMDDAEEVVRLLDVERVIVAFTNDRHEDVLHTLRRLRQFDVQIDIVPRLFDDLGPSVSIHSLQGMPLISLPPARLPRSSMVIKRTLDVMGALAVLVVISPLLVLIGLMIKRDSPGPVLYRHWRVGRDGKPFALLKFRTMRIEHCAGVSYGGDAADQNFARLMSDPERQAEFSQSYKLKQDPRVTRIGRYLRASSVDELPQLANVLRGDLSLVGPRALTSIEIEQYYGDAADELLAVRPGVTGYWQINGRSILSYAERVRLDLAYVGGWSLGLDLAILAKTLRVISTRRGAV